MGMRPQVNPAPSVLSNSSFRAWLFMSSLVRYIHPRSLKAPPKPSQFCWVELSFTVTVALPLEASIQVAVCQKLPGAEVTITMAGPEVPPDPVPWAPPLAVPCAPPLAVPSAPPLDVLPPGVPPLDVLPCEPPLDVLPCEPPLDVLPCEPPLDVLP